MSALFQLSQDLHNMQTDGFDQAVALDMLRTTELIEYSGELSSPQPLIADPLEALHIVVDFYMEVHDAAELFGQCMADGMSKFLDPTVHTPPIVLSDTEHIRIACALWLMKIHHQLLSKLTRSESRMHIPHLTDAFVASLQPLQVDQVLSLERKLQHGDYPNQYSLEYAGQAHSSLVGRLLSTSFVERYTTTLCRRNFRFFHVFVGSVQRRQQTQPTPSLPVERYKTLSLHLGLSFFDASRLAQWRINSAADVLTYADDAYHCELTCLDACETSSSRHARREETQIIEWTRCPESMTLQEWQKGKSVESDKLQV
jgi:hypothetical protein